MESLDRLLDASGPVALVMREHLRPVTGHGTPIFPPTYARDRSQADQVHPTYNIDALQDGYRAQVDSVGSQTNRMEAAFLEAPYADLVPQITIEVPGEDGPRKRVNLIEAPHRLADASVRFSGLHDEAEAAFTAYLDRGDAEPLARLSPLALVFGVWDSRATQAKVPRSLSMTIHADQVEWLTRSAQLAPAISGEDVVGDDEEQMEEKEHQAWAEVGLAHVPAARTHGGIISHGPIVREGTLNLVALRGIRGADAEATQRLQRYLMGLALTAATLPGPHNLRQGCLLVRDGKDAAASWMVGPEGEEETVALDHQEALEMAQAAARGFGVPEPRTVTFDAKAATDAMKEAQKGGKKR
ncbi:MAG: type I-U CRISPR-associated RAMP protein Csb1/Cas7u [Thiohalospira sp.]